MVTVLVDYAEKMQCLIFKVDFKKAYDSVNWSFLEYMMGRVGLCPKCVAWMKARVCVGKYVDPC